MLLVAVTEGHVITRITSGQATVTVEGRGCLPHDALQAMESHGTRRTYVTVYTNASYHGMSVRVNDARMASKNEATHSHGTGDERMQDIMSPEVETQGEVRCSGAPHFTTNLMHWLSSPATGRRGLWTPMGRVPLGAARSLQRA